MNHDVETMLEGCGIRATANRILVLNALSRAECPLSLIEIEEMIETLDRSSVHRALSLFHEHGLVHSIEDGRGVTKYELCHGDHVCSVADMHLHFYCERCEKVFCFDDIMVPAVKIPEDYMVHTANFMLKGICPGCAAEG